MDQSPRSILKVVQRESIGSSINSSGITSNYDDDTKSVIKAFIKMESKIEDEHKEILNNIVFNGYQPKVVDKVFYLERYAVDSAKEEFGEDKQRNSNIKINENLNNNKSMLSSSSSEKMTNPRIVQIIREKSDNRFSISNIILIILNISLFIGIIFTVFAIVTLYIKKYNILVQV
jgi:hypothetical protein